MRFTIWILWFIRNCRSPSFSPILNVSYFSLNDTFVSLKIQQKVGIGKALVAKTKGLQHYGIYSKLFIM